jgi:hypothetical protein
MALFQFFYNLIQWASDTEAPETQAADPSDPLQHPDIAAMTARQLADLPLGREPTERQTETAPCQTWQKCA